jgi:hypothetical protein
MSTKRKQTNPEKSPQQGEKRRKATEPEQPGEFDTAYELVQRLNGAEDARLKGENYLYCIYIIIFIVFILLFLSYLYFLFPFSFPFHFPSC